MFRIRPASRSLHPKLSRQTPTRQFIKRATHHHAAPPLLPLQSRIQWTYLWYAGILALGVTTGLGARSFAGPLGLPVPGSREDDIILESLSKDIDRLDIVSVLRSQSYNLHTDTALSSNSSRGGGGGGGRKISVYNGWLELDLNLGKAEEDKQSILGIMSGTRGLGVQRAFWNAETKEMVAVLWIGGGLSGWPGVVHGGAIATVFEEIMARMVRGPDGAVGMYIQLLCQEIFNSSFPKQISLVEANFSDLKHRPDTLSITYAKPTYALDFYIIRASFSKPDKPQLEPPPEPQSEPTKSWLSWLSPVKDLTKTTDKSADMEIIGTLETAKGDLCVRAKGTFGAH